MTDRACRTCKHFEPSPIRRKGWCRNPLLYSPQQSHLVHQDDLDCGHRLGTYWEPADSPEDAGPKRSGAEEKPEAAPLRFIRTEPQPATAAAGVFASSSSGGSTGNPLGSSGGSTGGGGSRIPPGGTGSGSGSGGGLPPLSGRPGGPGRPGGGQGPERSVSYQPEERYWTDYLRIAFPVLGLLLLLGLFWFWAMALIDDDDNGGDGTTVAGGGPTATSVVTQTTSGGLGNATLSTVENTPSDGEGQPPATTEAGDNGGDKPPTRTPRSTEEDTPTPESVGQFHEDDVVVTNAEANLRSEAATGENVIVVLPVGTELTVTGESEEADDHIWVPVIDADEQEGWVAEELLDAA